ncbi:MAG: nucleotidyltransferase domain-containing protein [Acidobacteria bacterium]|nr:nucleotidyltransferase domain-containing protein [Acidobacteriota bacterium]
MPVRSLNSSVLAWPDGQTVDRAVRCWAGEQIRLHPELLRLGYFGSYARGDWGVGSDLDLVAVVESSDEPFERRAARWDVTALPVPAEILVYTSEEWDALPANTRFARTLQQVTVWIQL